MLVSDWEIYYNISEYGVDGRCGLMQGASVRKLTCGAVLVAMQIVLARFCGIQINEGLRLSFEGIPILLAGIWLGPLWGMIVGCVADVLGTIISGYGVYFPLLTVGPMLLGGLGGYGARLLSAKGGGGWRGTFGLIAAIVVAEVVNSLLYGTWALTLYYSIILGQEMPFHVLFLARISTKPISIVAETLAVWSIHRLASRPLAALLARTGVSARSTMRLRQGSKHHEL